MKFANPSSTQWAGICLALAALLLYLLTLDNGLRPDELVGGDLITHQYAQVEARPSNAPGYPLYTMGGWLWFRVGQAVLGRLLNPIQILSLYSTLWGVASLLMLYLILLPIFKQRWRPAVLLTAFHATTFFFWYYSVTTEQYTSAVFQTLLLIWLAFRWEESVERSPAAGDRLLLGMAFISGTMLANMVTTLFILPPLLWFIFSRRTASGIMLFTYLQRPKLILQAVGVTALPLLSYAYIYIRGSQHPEWRGAGDWPTTWAWFIDFLTITQGRDELAPGLTLQTVFTDEFPTLMGQELTWPVFLGGLIGLMFLGRRRAIFLYSTLILYFLFCWGYRFGNWFQVIIPAYPIFTIGFAAGLVRVEKLLAPSPTRTQGRTAPPQSPPKGGKQGSLSLWERAGVRATESTPPQNQTHRIDLSAPKGDTGGLIPTRNQDKSDFLSTRSGRLGGRFAVHYLTLIILLILVVFRLTTNLPQANQHNRPDDAGLVPGWAILADRPTTPAVISSSFEEKVALEYLITVWGIAPDIAPTDAGNLEPPAETLAPDFKRYISRQAATVAPQAIDLETMYPQAAGAQLIRLPARPQTSLPATATPLDLAFGDRLQLAGWEPIETAPLPAGFPQQVKQDLPNWQIALYWQTSGPIPVDYTISVRPLVGGQPVTDENGPIIQDHQPVWGVYPTGRWRPNSLVRDVYALTLPPQTAPDAIRIVVYQATEAGFETLAEGVIPTDEGPMTNDE